MASVWMSTSAAVFLALASVCCILSLSSVDLHREDDQCDAGHKNKITVLPYISNLAIITVVSLGILAMWFIICGREHFTSDTSDCQMSRHNLHSKYSLWSIIVGFFIGYCTLGINYLIVGASCFHKWKKCRQDGGIVYRDNVIMVLLHVVGMAFAGFETIVCWMMKGRRFKSSAMVWHGLAVVQAANVVLWFDSILKESSRRITGKDHSLDAYFIPCNNESFDANSNSSNGTFLQLTHSKAYDWCTASSTAGYWFVQSSPFLFPITIEFALLVSETFFGKSIGAKSHSSNKNARESLQSVSSNQNSGRENMSDFTSSSSSMIFIMISVIINIIYVVATILVFVNYFQDIEKESQEYEDIFSVYLVVYNSLSIICCVVGIITCCTFSKTPHTHTTFLEYLLLFATLGVLLKSVKRLLAFIINSDDLSAASGRQWLNNMYCAAEILGTVEALLQIVLYYYAKDVQIPSNGNNAYNRLKVAIFKNIVVVMAIINSATWLSESFLLPEMSRSITPSHYEVDPWRVFDNVVTPITIFFRFNSALLFWCIFGSDVSQPGELIHLEKQTLFCYLCAISAFYSLTVAYC